MPGVLCVGMPILNSKGGPNLGEDDNTSQQSHPAAHPAPAAVQSGAQPQVQTKPCAEKVPRPQIKMGIVQDEFSYFKNRWTRQKSGINSDQHVMRTSTDASITA